MSHDVPKQVEIHPCKMCGLDIDNAATVVSNRLGRLILQCRRCGYSWTVKDAETGAES